MTVAFKKLPTLFSNFKMASSGDNAGAATDESTLEEI